MAMVRKMENNHMICPHCKSEYTQKLKKQTVSAINNIDAVIAANNIMNALEQS